MAARQDQTLQIVTIIVSGLAVVFFALAAWKWSQVDALRQEAAAAAQSESSTKGALNTKQNEVDAFKEMMGYKQADNLTDVQAQFEKDMQNYGGTFAETDRKYRVILETLAAEIQNSAEQESQAKKRLEEAEAEYAAKLAQKDGQITEFKKKFDEDAAETAKLRSEFAESRAAFENKVKELEQTLANSRSAYAKQLDDSKQQLTSTQETLERKDASLTKLMEERKQEDPSFEVADGRITWVNQRNRTVWINLGEADSLRPQVTFSVYEQDLADAGRSDKKGSIEVVRLLDDHLAEARITGDDIREPIMPGDHIYSPVWHEGKQIHYALTGDIDLDSDGANDMDTAKDLIRMNGGVVDMVLESNGEVTGEMSVETRYLVIGDFPRSGAANAAAKRKGYADMEKEAATYGVETITLQEFLNQMGYKPLDSTTDLKGGTKSGAKSRFRQRSAYVPIGA
ncbi:hypothetical protein Pla123a_27860 [Posidoniimonas polymericola]|uniref:Uncharacterized protein n=1 Tax=Posidoniimonas polymericola TaxID=2528002 RepID=A0A5C5YME4_9BACT|nr:hypothetical protein [Posidoniimonas polymericola]TWT76000.1 hypothetical protein Pla123a_27860 [Posidoniimonas polymericola]